MIFLNCMFFFNDLLSLQPFFLIKTVPVNPTEHIYVSIFEEP